MRIKHFFLWITLGYCSVSCTVVAPSRWVRYGLAAAEYVTAIAHVIVTHEQLTGKTKEKATQEKNLFLVVFWRVLASKDKINNQ